MGLAYEFARSELRIIGKNELKEKIATKIIELAATGERDPDKLCEFAIKGLRKRKNSHALSHDLELTNCEPLVSIICGDIVATRSLIRRVPTLTPLRLSERRYNTKG